MPAGELPLIAQGVSFAVLALTGVGLGLSFDLYRALRRLGRWPRWAADLADGVYAVLAVLLMAVAWLGAAWGEVRAYTALALVLGLGLYGWWGSPRVLPLASRAVAAVARAVRHLARGIGRPLAWIEQRALAVVQRHRQSPGGPAGPG